MSDKMREALEEVCRVLESNDSAIVDTIWVSTGQPETLLDHCKAALEVSEPAQVSQTARKEPVFYVDKTTINVFMIDPYSRQSVIGLRIGEYVNDTDIPLYLAPPDYEALKAENVRLEKCLSTANANAEKFEREWYLRSDAVDALETECKRLKLQVDELEKPVSPSLNNIDNVEAEDGIRYLIANHKETEGGTIGTLIFKLKDENRALRAELEIEK